MTFTVVYDACVLYPAPLRDLLVRTANTGIVRARWTEEILDECFRSILEARPDLKPDALKRTRALMCQAVPDCLVSGYEDIVDSIQLPDPDDRHVVAAAIRCGAQAIITFNLDDFPKTSLATYNIEPAHPDDFIYDNIDLAPATMAQVITEQSASLKNPPRTIAELLDTLRDLGLVQSVARLREMFA